MKANELRIGNWIVDEKAPNTPEQVDLRLLKVVQEVDGKYGDYERMQPIPLNEEWMGKLGFSHTDENDDWQHGTTLSWNKQGQVCLHEVAQERWALVAIDVKYVHQLQNLYFALTGEELEVKELA